MFQVYDARVRKLLKDRKEFPLYDYPKEPEIIGGFHGYGYMSSTAVGKAFIHGVVAARTLANSAA